MVMENSAPTTDYEKQIFDNMKDKTTYFQKFENKEKILVKKIKFSYIICIKKILEDL